MKKNRYNFEVISDWPDIKGFKTNCATMIPDNEVYVFLEFDEKNKDLSMEFIVDTNYYEWSDGGKWYESYWKRLKSCWKILKGNSLKYSSTFIFRGSDHIQDFCDQIYLLSKDVNREYNENRELRKKVGQLQTRIRSLEN